MSILKCYCYLFGKNFHKTLEKLYWLEKACCLDHHPWSFSAEFDVAGPSMKKKILTAWPLTIPWCTARQWLLANNSENNFSKIYGQFLPFRHKWMPDYHVSI